MPTETIKVISWTDRSWVRRQYQQFSGRFRLDETSGLYFDVETPIAHRKLISRTFLKLPGKVRHAAVYLGLTVSTTNRPATLSGDQSAVYGAWDRPHSQISPHLEITQASLTPEFVFPHLVHECCHLLWAIQTKAARAAYTNEIRTLVEELGADDFIEVTGYAQTFFDAWQEALLIADGLGILHRRNLALDKWVMESFCESVAKICCPTYKEREERHTEGLLELRQAAMAEHFELTLESRLVAFA
ncbi:hypothetical protein BH10CYA1_BH10CYA1_63690 [soil metagenome]